VGAIPCKWLLLPRGCAPQWAHPTCPTPSQQVRSELHVHPQEGAYEAGGNEAAGRVMEPRHRARRGPQAQPHGVAREKPTVCSGRKAAVLEAPRRVSRTPPGSESGACGQKGDSGTWASPWSPGGISGVGVPPGEGKPPGVARRRPPRTRAWCHQGPPSQRRAPRERGRRGSTARPRNGRLAVCAEQRPAGRELGAPGRAGGAAMSQGPTGGQATPGRPCSGRPAGSDAGLTHRIQATPEHGPTGPVLAGDGVQQRVSLDGPCGLAGSLSTDPYKPCPGGGPGAGPAGRGAPGRQPPGPARAAARSAGCGAARRTGLEREGRWAAEAEREPRRRGPDGPASGGQDSGGPRRAGVACVRPGLQPRAQSTPSAARAAGAGSDVAHGVERGGRWQWIFRQPGLGSSARGAPAEGPGWGKRATARPGAPRRGQRVGSSA
jgi:hypothetical protein